MKLIALLFTLALAGAAVAVEPHEMLKDPVLEARAREVSKHLRCVVCQNETIDESNAESRERMESIFKEIQRLRKEKTIQQQSVKDKNQDG